MSTKRIDLNTIFEEVYLKLLKDSDIKKEDNTEKNNFSQKIDEKSAKEEINLLENEDEVDEINLIEDDDADDKNKNYNKENNVTTLNNKVKPRDKAQYTRIQQHQYFQRSACCSIISF